MRSKHVFVGTFLVACLPALQAGCSTVPAGLPGRQVARHFSGRSCRAVQYDYLLYLPEGYGTRDRQWPLVLFLHGAGERGHDLEKVKRHGPPKLIEQGRQFPFVLVAPQCPQGQWWDTEALNALLDHVLATYAIDEDRVYLTGLSMGGAGTWNLAVRHPERFAAIVPICGAGLDVYAARKRLAHVPVWTFHGAKDKIVPIEVTRLIVESMKKGSGSVKFTVYPDAGHDAWTRTYENPEVWKWLLSQRRRSAEAPGY